MTCSELEYIPEGEFPEEDSSFCEGRVLHYSRFEEAERQEWERDMDREGEDYDREDYPS